MKRREFLAGVGATGIGFGLGGVSHLFPLRSPEVGPDWSPGQEEWVPSTCLLCPSHCGILGRVVDGQLVRIDGNPLHPLNRGGLCPKGKAGLQLLNHPSRLEGPLERTGSPGSDSFRPVSWDVALDRIASTLGKLEEANRSRESAWLVGHVDGLMGELLDRFARVHGSPHMLREDYRDGSEQVLDMSQGVLAPPAFDLDRSDLVLSFGAPLSEAWWCLPQAARARDLPPDRRGRWIQVDTRLSRTAIAADDWVPIRPGAYGSLALAMAYVLIKEGLFDARWIQRHVTGFEDMTDAAARPVPGYRTLALRHGRPETAARRIGLPVERVVELAKEFGKAQRPVALWDSAVTWRSGGLVDAMAIHGLNILIGALQRPGGVFVQRPLPVPSLEQIQPTRARGARRATLTSADWAEKVAGGERLEALFLYGSNPVASAPDPGRVREALSRIPLVVSFSPFLDETARHADLVLPDHVYLERWQDAPSPPTVPYPVWGVVQPVVPPRHDTRATGDVLLDLARRMGGSLASALPWSSVEELVGERGRALAAARRGGVLVAGFRRGELYEMERRGWWNPHGRSPDRFWKSVRESGGWFDPYYDDVGRGVASERPDRKVALLPAEARERITGAAPGGVEAFLPLAETSEKRRSGEGVAEGQAEDELQLVPFRVMTLASGTTALTPWLLENAAVLTGSGWEAWVEMNPETAAEHGLANGQMVRVESPHGSFQARLHLYAGAQPGMVNAPYGLHTSAQGWGEIEPVNPLAAVGGGRDSLTGLPDWYSTRVRVQPA